jgi:predicted transporter
MKKNIGGIDRSIRFILGLLIIGAGIYFKSYWGLVGIVMVATALFRFCPLYTFLFRSRPASPRSK